MYKIKNIKRATKRTSEVLSLFDNVNITVSYSQEEDALLFPDFGANEFAQINPMSFEVKDLHLNTPSQDVDECLILNNLANMSLDWKSFRDPEQLEFLMYQFNMLLHKIDLQLINIENRSDYMAVFITRSAAETPEDIIDGALRVVANTELKSKDFFTYCNKPDESNGEMTAEEMLHHVLENVKVNENKLNFNVLQEFLEEYAPEYEYELIKRKEKTFIKIKEEEE